MTLTFEPEGASATSSDCTPAVEYNLPARFARTDTGAVSVTADVTSTDVRDIAWTTGVGLTGPNSPDWPSGDYIGSFEVAANPASVSFKIELSRVNISCTQQGGGPLGTSGALTGTGVKSFTANTNPAAGSHNDRFQCQILTSNSSHCAETFTVTINDVDTFMSGPWTFATWDQDSFRVRNDDGTDETDATWKAAVNISLVEVATDTNFRVRFLVQETGGGDSGKDLQLQLQRSVNGGSWINVTAASSFVRIFNSTKLTAGGDTTQQVGGGTFLTDNNWVDDDDGLTGQCVFSGSDEAEAEFCLQLIDASVFPGDIVGLRVVDADGDAALDAYTNELEVVAAMAFSALSEIGYPDWRGSEPGPWQV